MRSLAVTLVLLGSVGAHAQERAAAEAVVEEHCISCHGEDKVSGGLDLTRAPEGRVAGLWRWSRLRERVRSYEMPPLHVSEITPVERAALVTFVDGLLAREVPQLPTDAGRVTIRRLSRSQWRNTVVDQLGVDVDVRAFPADDLGYGFDSIGDALTFSTLHLEKYLAAAGAVAADVFHGEDPDKPKARVFAGGAMRLVRGGATMSSAAHMYSHATVEQAVDLPREGVYRLRLVAAGRQAGDEPARMRVDLDGRRLEVLDVANTRPEEFVIEQTLSAGRHTVAASFVNDYYNPKHPDPRQRDRNLDVVSLTVEGPVDARVVPAQQEWIAPLGRAGVADEADAVQRLVDAALPRLWRRAPEDAARARLLAAAQQRLADGEQLVDVQRFVLTAALASPRFLFRVEPAADGELDAASFASRLSYFLWASAPDEALLRAAREGGLVDPAALEGEVDRMLRDRRAERLATDFAGQWLELRSLATTRPDPARYPFSDDLRASMARETELLFWSVLSEGQDVRRLLDADYTFVDARLAEFYGLPHEGDRDAFVRTVLTGDARRRGGLLGHGSVLAVTSNPTRTSPVKRGKWILDNLLGQSPPPPPPGNDSFEDEGAIDGSATLREQMAQHRERSKCAICHVRMDTLGLALERFDAIGRYRAQDAAGAIDASGELPDGRVLEGAADLKRALAADPTYVRTVAHKLFVYAVGRDLRPVDRLRIDHAVQQLGADTVTMRDLILLVVRDPAFAGRRAE